MKKPKVNKLIVFLGIGLEAVGLIVGAVWLGDFLDKHYETKVLFTSILPILALIGWFVHVIVMVKNINSDS